MNVIKKISNKMSALKNKYACRIIFDCEKKLGSFNKSAVNYRTDYCKEIISRDYVFRRQEKTRGKFLDVGGGEGDLMYLLGISKNLMIDHSLYKENQSTFSSLYDYFALDLLPKGENVIYGDICRTDFLEKWPNYHEEFNIIYSNNVFEHLQKPWVAAENLYKMLKKGGICITIVPFSARYHEVPQDYFRYTHQGLISLFKLAGDIEVLESGYDIIGRRNNWQGSGEHNDIVPMDKFGAWRENWYSLLIFRKT